MIPYPGNSINYWCSIGTLDTNEQSWQEILDPILIGVKFLQFLHLILLQNKNYDLNERYNLYNTFHAHHFVK